MSQNDQILQALEAGDILSPREALDRFHSFRLGARIKDLRKLGHNIVNLKKGGYACYKLIPPQRIELPPAYKKVDTQAHLL